jgi:hypothetical protein
MLKELLGVLICLTMLAGCATASGSVKFQRYGIGNVKNFSIPVFSGTPPPEYPYTSLGQVQGKPKHRIFRIAIDQWAQAVEDMAQQAKAMGANAVINIKGPKIGSGAYEGEAVIFERLPDLQD